jgi:hypothetical protein
MNIASAFWEFQMDKFDRQVAKLTPEDRSRMQQLSAEIQDRLKEMTTIFGRTLNITIDDSFILKYHPEPQKTHGPAGGQHINLVCAPEGSPCGCYVDPPGECVYTGNPNGC